MKEKTRKLIQWIFLGLAVLGGIFAIFHATGSESDHVLEGMTEAGNPLSSLYDIAYYLLIVIMLVAIVSILFFVFRQFISNFKDDPKKARRSLFSVGLMILVVIISFIFAKGTDVSQAMLDKNNLTVGVSKWIGAACFMVYIMVVVAILTIVYTELNKMFKKK